MMEGGGASVLNTTSDARSKALREMIERRRTFQPMFIHDLGVVEGQYDRAFDLLDGIYARLTHEPANPSTPLEDEPIARLSVKDISGDCHKPAKVTQLDIFPVDISIAPSLDLIVLLVSESETGSGPFLRLYLRTISSGGLQDHPDTKNPVLRFPNKARSNLPFAQEFHLSIDEDIVALHVTECSIELFRWTTGQHIVVSLEGALEMSPNH